MVLHGFCWFWDLPGRPQIHEISTLGSYGDPKVTYGSICVASGSFRDDIWELLGAIWELLGVIWELLGAICDLLGDIWQLPNDIWERFCDNRSLHTSQGAVVKKSALIQKGTNLNDPAEN